MRKKSLNKNRRIGVLIAALIFSSCSSHPPVKHDQPVVYSFVVPVGVDSSIAREAFYAAKELFVPWQYQQFAQQKSDSAQSHIEEANALWDAFQATPSRHVVSADDTLKAIEKYNEGGKNFLRAAQLQNAESGNQEDIRKQVQAYLEKARKGFEEAIQLNPFDRKTRLALAKTYQLLAERFLSEKNMAKAIDILENLVRLEKDQHGLYGRLAQAYSFLHNWEDALKNFRHAEHVLRATAIFSVSADRELSEKTALSAIDSSALFLYVFYQAETNIRLYRPDSALFDLRRSRNLARNEADRKTVEATIKWIQWDDGNIRASEIRDSLFVLIDQKQYPAAAEGLAALLSILKTKPAKREINWRLALLEYSHLEKESSALKRMQAIVHFFTHDTTGLAAADTLKKHYYKSFGTMCHNQGLKALRNKKLIEALTYFQQSTAIPWEHRAKSFLEIAKISINSPEKVILNTEQALAERQHLSFEEQLTALNLQLNALKRKGQFERAKEVFLEFRKLKSQAKKHATSK